MANKVMDIKTNILWLQHIGIPTPDLAASRNFYQQLGFTPVFTKKFTGDDGQPGEALFMTKGGLTLELYVSANPALKPGAVDHLALNVQDIDAAYSEINRLGLNNTQDTVHFLPFFNHGVKYFTIEGPSREKVEFNQYLKV